MCCCSDFKRREFPLNLGPFHLPGPPPDHFGLRAVDMMFSFYMNKFSIFTYITKYMLFSYGDGGYWVGCKFVRSDALDYVHIVDSKMEVFEKSMNWKR